MQAAIGLQQLDKLPAMDAARRRNFESLKRVFSKYHCITKWNWTMTTTTTF